MGGLLSVAIANLARASSTESGLAFVLDLLLVFAALALAPVFAYGLYALWSATYILERDMIRLQWGLRVEEIPIQQVRWVHSLEELESPPPLPWPRWPGSVVGTRHWGNQPPVEFLASRPAGLILIAASDKIFAISPGDPRLFLRAYQSLTEQGSLSERARRSVQPAALLANFWNDLPARLLILAALALSLSLLIWVSLVIPIRPTIPFRFDVNGLPIEYVPGVRLMLLPVIDSIMSGFDLLLGMFFYRRPESRVAAYLLWIGSVVSSILFLLAVYFLTTA